MAGAYRDERAAVWSRIESLEAEIAAREGQATATFWQSLSPEMARALSAARAEPVARDATLEELLVAQAARERHLAALDRALALLPEMEAAWRALPPAAPCLPTSELFGWSATAFAPRAQVEALSQALSTLLPAHDPRARLWREGSSVLRGEFHTRGAPLGLLAGVTDKGEVRLALATGVSAALGTLRLDPEGMGDAILKTVGLRREVALGDPAFDHCFLVRSSDEVARALLPPPVRAALLVMAREDVPRLEVGHGMAVLRWCYEPTATALEAAVQVLAFLRAAPPVIHLRR